MASAFDYPPFDPLISQHFHATYKRNPSCGQFTYPDLESFGFSTAEILPILLGFTHSISRDHEIAHS
jgi:hypothetical protein